MSRFIKGWKQFQHYKRRRPPWIKLYRELLDDPDWHNLDGGAAKSLIMLWLIASENGGQLPDDNKTLAFRLRKTEAEIAKLLSQLSPWLTGDASNMLATCLHDATPETETETEGEVAASSLRSEAKKATRLSENWQPSDDNLHFAEQQGFSASEIEFEAARFRDYWISRPGAGGVKRNWSATWRNWIRKAIEPKAKSNGRYVQDDSKSAGAAAGRLLELAKRGQFTFGPRPSLLPSKSDAAVELLPPGRRAQS